MIESYYNLQNLKQSLQENSFFKVRENIFINQDIEFTWPDINKEVIIEKGKCLALKDQIAVLVDGTVVPCCLDSNGKINLGNIYTDSFDSIINSKRCLDLKKSFQDRKPCEKLCLNCTYKNRFK